MIWPETTQTLFLWSWAPNLLLPICWSYSLPHLTNHIPFLPWLGSPLTPVFICPHSYVSISPICSTFIVDLKYLKYTYFPPHPPLQCRSKPSSAPKRCIARCLSWCTGFCSHCSSQNGLRKVRSCCSSAPALQWFLPDSEFQPNFVGWPAAFASTLSLWPDTWDSISHPSVSPFCSVPISGMALSSDTTYN